MSNHIDPVRHIQPSAATPSQVQMGRNRRRPKSIQEMNLTSMLDVCFLLLVFFLLTASFTMGEGYLPADLPQPPPPDEEASIGIKIPEQPIIITLRSLGDGAVVIQVSTPSEPPSSFAELRHQLKALQNRPDNPFGVYKKTDPIIIKPDGIVSWEHVIDAYNQCVAAKYENINFAEAR